MSTISQYEAHAGDGDQKNFKSAQDNQPQEPYSSAPENASKLNDPLDQHSLANRAKAEKQQEKLEQQQENAPREKAVWAAEKNGNKPSRGARIDDELAAEDEQRLREMDGK